MAKQSEISMQNRLLRHVDGVLSKIETLSAKVATNYDAATDLPLQIGLIGFLKKNIAKQHLNQLTPEAAREQFRRSARALYRGFAIAKSHNLTIDLATHSLEARHYSPCANTAATGLMLYFHGGGFVIGDLDTHDDICRLLCQQTQMQVLSVAYRLAPEHPFPAGLEDACAAFQWVQKNCVAWGIDPKRIAVAGDSAGGNYAAILAQKFASELMACLLIYPSTDRSRDWPSAQRYADSAFLSQHDRDWFYQHYLKGKQLNDSPMVSPLLSLQQQLSQDTKQVLPKTVLVTGGHDVLQDEGAAYAKLLQQAGTTVSHLHFPRLDHGFMHFIAINKTAYAAAKQISATFKLLCQPS